MGPRRAVFLDRCPPTVMLSSAFWGEEPALAFPPQPKNKCRSFAQKARLRMTRFADGSKRKCRSFVQKTGLIPTQDDEVCKRQWLDNSSSAAPTAASPRAAYFLRSSWEAARACAAIAFFPNFR